MRIWLVLVCLVGCDDDPIPVPKRAAAPELVAVSAVVCAAPYDEDHCDAPTLDFGYVLAGYKRSRTVRVHGASVTNLRVSDPLFSARVALTNVDVTIIEVTYRAAVGGHRAQLELSANGEHTVALSADTPEDCSPVSEWHHSEEGDGCTLAFFEPAAAPFAVCTEDGTCFPDDFTQSPPSEGYPYGHVTLGPTACAAYHQDGLGLHYFTCASARDIDGDLVPDAMDNCRDVANANQADNDDDLVGDVCE